MHIPGGFLSNLTLKSKIGLIVVIGLLLVISVFGYLGLTALGRSTEARLQERLTIARLVADYQDEVLGLALKGLEVAAGSLDKRTTDAGERFDLAGRELASLYTTLSQLGLPIGDVFVLDREGKKVWGVLPWLDTKDAPIGLDPSVQRTLATGNSTVSGLTSIPSVGGPVVLLSSSVRAGEGVLVVAVDLSQSSIATLMKPVLLGETGYAELVDEKGVVLARTSPGKAPAFFEKSDHPDKFAALIASGKPAVGTCHRCHIEAEQTTRLKDVLAFAPLTQASWGVAIRQSEEEALAVTRELKQGLIAAGVLMSAVTLGLIWLATSNVVTRIRSLNTAALKMASGDLSTPIPFHGRDELGALAQTLDSTRIELKTSYEAVEQRTRELGALFAISKTLTSTPEVSMMLDAVMAKVVEVIPGSDGGLLLLYDGDTDRFLLKSAVGIGPGLELKDVAIPRHADIRATPAVHCAIPSELPPELHRLTETICAKVLRLAPVQARVRNAAGAPLVSRGQLIGILILGNFRDNAPFTYADLHLLQALVNEVAMAVETVRLSQQEEEGRLLRETDRLKSEFLSIVSHELRTPLTSIKGYATSLLRE
ncbi:MAG: HAMP domain-containing protein, partial [Chloroflexota bacterium]